MNIEIDESNIDKKSFLFMIENLKNEIEEIKKAHKNTKKELKELKEEFVKLKGNKIIF